MGDVDSGLNYTSRITLKDELSQAGENRDLGLDSPDRRDGRVYVYEPSQQLAAEVALVTGRPLLLRGKPGTGKSSFAAFLARNLSWRYFEHVVTARTQARDLLWTFDAVRRLGDAQLRNEPGQPLNDFEYVEPGVLWWAIDPESAERRGLPKGNTPPTRPASDPSIDLNRARPHQDRAVVLIDEIDKADPDVPNNLLVALGSHQFQVEETRTTVARPSSTAGALGDLEADLCPLLVVITTNEERELPLAFTRRCVVYTLKPPSAHRLVEIADRHIAAEGRRLGELERRLLGRLAERVVTLRDKAEERGAPGPSTAEYLDAVRACRALGIDTEAAHGPARRAWELVERVVLLKHGGAEE